MKILSDEVSKLVVMDITTGKEITVITNELVTTAGDEIVVKVTPIYD